MRPLLVSCFSTPIDRPVIVLAWPLAANLAAGTAARGHCVLAGDRAACLCVAQLAESSWRLLFGMAVSRSVETKAQVWLDLEMQDDPQKLPPLNSLDASAVSRILVVAPL
jgi:hypothetical protein